MLYNAILLVRQFTINFCTWMVQCCNPKSLPPTAGTTLNATPGDDLSPTKWVVCKHLGSQWVRGLHVAMAHQEVSKTERNRKVQVSRTCQNVSLRFRAPHGPGSGSTCFAWLAQGSQERDTKHAHQGVLPALLW